MTNHTFNAFSIDPESGLLTGRISEEDFNLSIDGPEGSDPEVIAWLAETKKAIIKELNHE